MVWLNNQHINESVPEGTFGGSKCTCTACAENRKLQQHIEELEADLNKSRLLYKEAKEEIDRLREKLKDYGNMDAYIDALPKGFDLGDDATVEIAVELSRQKEIVNRQFNRNIEQLEKIRRYETALKQYADEEKWLDKKVGSTIIFSKLGPQIAQEALMVKKE